MYMGGDKQADGSLKRLYGLHARRDHDAIHLQRKAGYYLLSDNIVPLGGRKIKEIFEKKGLTVDDIDYFLPHISSNFSKVKFTI